MSITRCVRIVNIFLHNFTLFSKKDKNMHNIEFLTRQQCCLQEKNQAVFHAKTGGKRRYVITDPLAFSIFQYFGVIILQTQMRGDGIFENELFATRGGTCGRRSARFLWELCTPCYAIFRGNQVSQGVLCGGGMDPAPLLKI